MWFERSYSSNSIGTFDELDMFDYFKDFYGQELRDSPKDTKGLAMFEGGFHYFHTNCHYHIDFFNKHGCSPCEEPLRKIKFLYGDEEFGENIIKTFSNK